MDLLDCVAFILIEGNRFLAEKRKLTKKADPGAIAIPGGHMKRGESCEQALHRETREELGLVPSQTRYVCSLLHRSPALHKIHYFVVESWAGEIENNEAESLLWIPLGESERLDIDVDRVAISEYVRVYGSNLP
jgi:8-oxo-dGTP pyrophosphatase MutT (NUDIX family)